MICISFFFFFFFFFFLRIPWEPHTLPTPGITLHRTTQSDQSKLSVIHKSRIVLILTRQSHVMHLKTNVKKVEANHERKKRIKQLQERLSQVDKRCEFLRDSKASANSQSIEVAKHLAVARERREQKEASLEAVNNGLGELPMVLGKSLGKVLAETPGISGGEELGRPSENLDLIKHELVFRELQEQVKEAQKAHKGSLQAATEQWGAEQRKINDESAYQMTLNKLASLGDRVKVARDKDQRMDVVGAINLFHVKGKTQEMGLSDFFYQTFSSFSFLFVPLLSSSSCSSIIVAVQLFELLHFFFW
jgi:hypothetical protein